jgi:hypothetical protein
LIYAGETLEFEEPAEAAPDEPLELGDVVVFVLIVWVSVEFSMIPPHRFSCDRLHAFSDAERYARYGA